MTGAYTEIVEIQAPDEAVAGDTVNVAVGVSNTWTDAVHIYCVAVLDSESRFIDWLDAWVDPGETRYFNGSFVMPEGDVTINVFSYFQASDGNVYLDDSRAKDVKLSAAPAPTISNFAITNYARV